MVERSKLVIECSGCRARNRVSVADLGSARTAGWIAHTLEEYGEPVLRFRARDVHTGP